jgi:hypothetical protein
MKGLLDIAIHANQLMELPPEIGNLVNLRFLSLGDNKLTRLPPAIGRMQGLIRLQLYENQLTELPPEIGNLVNLEVLRLQKNKLIKLPTEIGKLTNLRTLDLKDNQLTELPPEIMRLANLRKLEIAGNPLRLSDAQRKWIAELEAKGREVPQTKALHQATLRKHGDEKLASREVITERWVKNVYANGDVTMADKETGLMWLYDASLCGKMNWADAVAYCNKLTYAGYSDWRLPDIGELKAQFSQKEFFAGVEIYAQSALNRGLCWSSTPYGYGAGVVRRVEMRYGVGDVSGGSVAVENFAWYVDIRGRNASGTNKTYRYYVWPVRGGQ